MIFGIGAGLYFAYMPYIRYNSIPFISFRIFPGHLINNFNKNFRIRIIRKKFRDVRSAMDELDRLLEMKTPVGVITNLFFIPYFPENNRFHFNNHNMIVYGRENGQYLVSDPIMEEPVEISYSDLARARFSYGMRNLRGNLYYISEIPDDYNLEKMIIRGIRATVKNMTTPMPLNGVRGIRYLAGRVKKWPRSLNERMAKLYLGNIIRMLEEVGTGGSGFRYIYAAFLQESASILNQELLAEASEEMTIAGDTWRDFSYHAAKILKTSNPSPDLFSKVSESLLQCSLKEEQVYRKLSRI